MMPNSIIRAQRMLISMESELVIHCSINEYQEEFWTIKEIDSPITIFKSSSEYSIESFVKGMKHILEVDHVKKSETKT